MAVVRKEVEKVAHDFINKWQDRNDYLTDPIVLKEALDEYENWVKSYGTYDREIYYFSLRTSQDQLDTKIKARYNQIIDLGRKLQNDIQFFSLRLAKVPREKQKEFLNSTLLRPYRHFLEMLFEEAKYQLSEAEEKIITLKKQASKDNWIKMLDSFLAKEEREVTEEDGTKVIKSLADLSALLYRQNKTVRDSAATAINDVLAQYAPTAEHEINSILGNKKIDDELRHFPRPDSARHLTDDVDTKVVDILIKTVSDRFDLSRRWYRLKANLLGLEKLEYHERLIEYGKITKSFTFTEASAIVSTVFNNLDPEFGQIFDGFISNSQIDVYPSKGKSDGAYCAAGSPVLPTYILLNHTNILADVRTLAHESGHGVNDELMKKHQNALNFGSPLSTAEVASTFMEDFVWQDLIKEADEEQKLTLMAKKLDDDIATIFRQAACYQFEQELHLGFRKKGYLSQQEIGALFQKHMASYLGPAVILSPGSENWWVYWGHIRRFFYVYSYVSGLLISKSLQASVKQDNSYIAKVKIFLSAGSSQSPQDIFKDLGIDISLTDFWEKGLAQVESLLVATEKLALKLGKISSPS